MGNDKILILKDDYNSFEQFYIDNLKKIGVDAYYYYNSHCFLKKIFTHYGIVAEWIWYGNWKYNIRKYDIIIVFDSIHTSKILKFIKKEAKTNCKIIMWHWNPIITKEDKKIYTETRNFIEHWSFNPMDCCKFNMKMNNQFFFDNNNKKIFPKEHKDEYTIFFVGRDKNRYNLLSYYKKMFGRLNIKTDFYLQRTSETPDIDDPILINKGLEYDYVIKEIWKSDAVLELVQDKQNGLTARTLEATFYNKKLITNNAWIKNCDLFDTNNIYVIEEAEIDLDEFNKFMKKPYKKLQKSILEKYTAQGWLNNFLN